MAQDRGLLTPEKRAKITELQDTLMVFGGRTKVIKIVIDDEGEKPCRQRPKNYSEGARQRSASRRWTGSYSC